MTVIAPPTAYSPPEFNQDWDDALIVREVPWRDPLAAFAPFADDPVASLLHGDGDRGMGRWSYMAVSPFCTVSVDAALTTYIDGEAVPGNAFDVLDGLLRRYRCTATNAPAPFLGGAVGFFGYALGRLIERLPAPHMDTECPAMVVGLYDVVVAFDHVDQRTWIMATGFPEQDAAARITRATKRASWIEEKLGDTTCPALPFTPGTWMPDQPRADVERAISDTIDYIHAGDIFQANITQRFRAKKPNDVTPWALFQRLRDDVPSPFGAYVAGHSNFHVLSASPERFLRLSRSGEIETRPIKGTRPRSQDPHIDAALAAELDQSGKDHAENLMIVDLMRNDISRVCETGSVDVPQCSKIETFARVHHLVSVVTGQLDRGKTAIDLLRACFPGGSVTGAPKVRAMEIIEELEPMPRGPYCGAIGWIGFDGAMDSSIVIRSLVIDGEDIIAQAGGGIVSDSDPSQEFEEAMVKIRPLLSVLDQQDHHDH